MITNKTISVAIADDYELVRKGLRMVFNTFKDCTLDIEAVDGIDLLEKLESIKKLPDVCILDINMPRMDGYKALKSIKSIWPQIKVIMLSMHHNEYSVIKSFQDGASACLPKEIGDEELHNVILKVYETGLYHSELTSQFINKVIQKQSIDVELTEKEIEFLRLNCRELTLKQIAEIMKVSPRTVDSYRDSLFKKLNVSSRTALAVLAISSGISQVLPEHK